MSCCNNCQGYYNNCGCSGSSSGGITRVIVGPQGPAGPQGPSFIASSALYTDTAAIASPTLALSTQYPSSQTDIVLSGTNTVTLTSGYYLVQYGSNATSTTSDTPNIYLTLNGTAIVGSTRVGTADAVSNLSGQYLVQSTGSTTLGLVFDPITGTTYGDSYLLVTKLS